MPMASYVQTGKKYLELKPEAVSFSELIHYLYSGDIESKQFIESLRAKETSLKRRGFIFLSVLVQRALQSMAVPLSTIGSVFEFWLNLIACNGNFCTFLLNIVRDVGKVRMPAKESAKYVSFLGHLDSRIELDKSVKPGDKRYFAGLSVMASKLAYENNAFCKAVVEDQWKMEFLGAYDFWNEYQERNSTQGLIFHDKSSDPDTVIVAFRGTEPFNSDDWCTDFDLSWTKFKTMGYVHSGFMKALGLQKNQSWPENVEDNREQHLAYYSIREKLRTIFLQNSQTRFILTGHSLGGALAVLFPAILALHDATLILERLEAIYTFGQPRVGDEIFGNFVNAQLKQYGVKYYRYVYNYDIVCRLPYDSTTLMFKHFGTCIYYNSLYQGKIVPNEPHKNYFSFRAVITRTADCLWELLRSFLLPQLCGPEYREGWLLLLLRLFGVFLMSGLPAHGIHEYINAIRLGTADLFC